MVLFRNKKKNAISDLHKNLSKKPGKIYEAENNMKIIGKKYKNSIKGFCIIKYKDGIYIGELINNKWNGFAYNYFQNNLIFKGEYKEDWKISGIVFYKDLNKIIYWGNWKDDVYHGIGELNT